MKSYILKSPMNASIFLGTKNGKPHFGIEVDDVSEALNEKAWIKLGEHLEKYGSPIAFKENYSYKMSLTDEQLKEIDNSGFLDCYQVENP